MSVSVSIYNLNLVIMHSSQAQHWIATQKIAELVNTSILNAAGNDSGFFDLGRIR